MRTIDQILTMLREATDAIEQLDHRDSNLSILQARAEVAIAKLVKEVKAKRAEILNP